jgi:hypothetical protein
MKEDHYPRQLGASLEESPRCFVPEDDSSRPAILGLWEKWVDWLTEKVHLIVLHLAFETFSPEFSVSIAPIEKIKFQDLIPAWSVDLSWKTINQAQQEIRDLVNTRLLEVPVG